MHSRHVGFRVKLLLFYIITVAAVVSLDISVQLLSYNAVREFETRLSRYHDIHRLRQTLSAHYNRMERVLRESDIPDAVQLDEDQQFFYYNLDKIEESEPESLSAFFNIQASRRGIDAYFLRLNEAVRLRAQNDRLWYADMAATGRIFSFVDDYLAVLLSEVLKSGSDRYQQLISRINRVRRLTLGALVLFTLLFGMAAFAFSDSVAAPIIRLAHASRRIARGDLDVPELEVRTGDEIEILTESFNTMSRSIRSMVDDLKGKAALERKLREEERELMDKERALREAQFINLQDQIRPHFLFNAINTIARTALFEKAEQTERLTLALGKLFRYSLASPEALVSMKEELAVVEEYLRFQQLRFGERLEWMVLAPDSVMDITIPRFTLQPFVENAVRHGIEPLEAGGRVEVRVSRRNNRIYVKISDSGTGPDNSHAGNEQEGIGISNVRKRLELLYGSEASLCVKGKKGCGTVVQLSFPDAVPILAVSDNILV